MEVIPEDGEEEEEEGTMTHNATTWDSTIHSIF